LNTSQLNILSGVWDLQEGAAGSEFPVFYNCQSEFVKIF